MDADDEMGAPPNPDWDGMMRSQARADKSPRAYPLTDALAENVRLRARVAALEAALAPFAKEANLWDDFSENNGYDGTVIGRKILPMGEGSHMTVADVRRARALLQGELPR